MDKFVITGGKPLTGTVDLCGAKNSGFKLMIAALYSNEFCIIHDFSKIGDILVTAEIIKELGGEVSFEENHTMMVCGNNLNKQEFSVESARLSRASTYFIGPLIHRFGKAVIPMPGGCKIGKRPVNWHLKGLESLGAEIKEKDGYYEISAKKLHGGVFEFPKNTHGGTDVMVIASVCAEGITVLKNAALEPEVNDLIVFLNKMGAKIRRDEGREIIIEGVETLHSCEHNVMKDRNEAVTFGCVALATKGDIFVKRADQKVLESFLKSVEQIGGGYETKDDGIRFYYKGNLKSLNIVTQHYPGFMTDWMPIWMILMTQTKGVSIVHETVHNNRFTYVPELKKMGANIELFNPNVPNPGEIYNFSLEDDSSENFHAAKVIGPTVLKGTEMEISDLRAGASLILASLIAQGKSELTGVEHVDRGYENLDERLRGLGADIERVS